MADSNPFTCNSCAGTFPKKEKPGDCGKYTVLDRHQTKHSDQSNEYRETFSKPQCQGCGSLVKHLIDGVCPRCADVILTPAGDEARAKGFAQGMNAAQEHRKRLDQVEIVPVGGNIPAILATAQQLRGPHPSAPPPTHATGIYRSPPPPPLATVQLTTSALQARRDGGLYQVTVTPQFMFKKASGKAYMP
ncbi:hypothetical protein BDZ89DRAFT_1052656 [Hymenopellis radicata]|nr:hypothetical protein BDZ89DRAFT_1052656 [Hymenopellis radicata]